MFIPNTKRGTALQHEGLKTTYKIIIQQNRPTISTHKDENQENEILSALHFLTINETYELHEGLVVVGADVALSVDDLPEGFAELDELLLRALPWQVPQVQHLRRHLRVPELGLARRRHQRFR